MTYAEIVGPYTLTLALVLLFGLPIVTWFMRRIIRRIIIGPVQLELADKIDEVKTHVVETKQIAAATEHAVNNVDVGEPRLVDQVRYLRGDVTALTREMASLSKMIGDIQANWRRQHATTTKMTTDIEMITERTEDTAHLLRRLIERNIP